MNKIEIWWEGPYTLDEIKKFSTGKDYGLYQIYGEHIINGSNNLLYIGLANDQTFSSRITQHFEWLKWQPSSLQIFVGRLGGTKLISLELWEEYIEIAERILIYYCKPPFNSKNLNNIGSDVKDTIVFNFGQINKLPREFSTFWNDSPFWSVNDWEVYDIERHP